MTITTNAEVLERLRQLLPELQTRFAVTRLVVYGGYAQPQPFKALGRAVDIFVETAHPIGLDLLVMRELLTAELQRTVSLKTPVILGLTLLAAAEASGVEITAA